MDVWRLIGQAEALPPVLIFAAGAVSVVLIQGIVVALRRLLARCRAARAAAHPARDPRRLRADAERLRKACDASAASLQVGIARLKQRALERVRALERASAEAHDLQRELAEKSAIIADLEQAQADMELWKEKHLLELRRQEDELRARADGLAAAQQTIAMLRDLLERSGRGLAPTANRAAR
jgi:DNA repair exonuclease SbcCD ATPase subunit